MRIDIVHQRDPDSECSVDVYVDGTLVSDVHVWSFDPGAGYDMEDFQAMRAESIEAAPEFLKPVLDSIFDEMEPTYERWSC